MAACRDIEVWMEHLPDDWEVDAEEQRPGLRCFTLRRHREIAQFAGGVYFLGWHEASRFCGEWCAAALEVQEQPAQHWQDGQEHSGSTKNDVVPS